MRPAERIPSKNPPTSSDWRRALAFLPTATIAAVIVAVASVAAWAASDEVAFTLADSKRTYQVLAPNDAGRLSNLPLVVYLHANSGPESAGSSKPPRAVAKPPGRGDKSPGGGDATGEDKLPEASAAAPPGHEAFKRDWWPILAQRNCVVVMPRCRNPYFWPASDAEYILEAISDVQRRYRIDPNRRLLLGISGGGQVALYLADSESRKAASRPAEALKFRAVIVVSTNPVAVRGDQAEFFYPARETLKACPYLVVNPISEGSALMYWRQVREKLSPLGASISILPALGAKDHYVPPPRELPAWLDEVLAGKQPKPLEDPQQAAVAKMFAQTVAALAEALETAKPIPTARTIAKDGQRLRLLVPVPPEFERSTIQSATTEPAAPQTQPASAPAQAAALISGRPEETKDTAGNPLTEIRTEHAKWPIFIRCDARATDKPMAEVLAAEELQTRQRGMLYQVYHTGTLAAAGRSWKVTIGSITYPDRRRGWVSSLFIHATTPISPDGLQWLEVLVSDETQQSEARELAGIVKTILTSIAGSPR